MRQYNERSLEIYRTYSDAELEDFLGVDLQVVWENMGESEENYEEEVLYLIDKKLGV